MRRNFMFCLFSLVVASFAFAKPDTPITPKKDTKYQYPDLTNVVYRVGVLENKLHDREELLNEKFHSDVDKLIPIAASMQAAARAQGKELRIKDIAMYLREKRLRKEREESKGAKANERT